MAIIIVAGYWLLISGRFPKNEDVTGSHADKLQETSNYSKIA
jgi:hypothetical protein